MNTTGKNRQSYDDAFFNLNQIYQLEQRFRFCWLNRSVELHCIKETDTQYYVSSLSELEEIVSASPQKTKKEILVKICRQLKALKVHALH